MCFRFLQVAWAFFWTGELPVHEQAKVEGLDDEIERDQAAGSPEAILVGESVALTEDREHILGPRGRHRRTEGQAKPGSRRDEGDSK